MLKLPKLNHVPSIYGRMPDQLRRPATPTAVWRKAVGAFISEQFLIILHENVLSGEEGESFSRLNAGHHPSKNDLAMRPLLTGKIDALILHQSEELGQLIQESEVARERMLQWMNIPNGSALRLEWGKRAAMADRLWQGRRRPRISDNPDEHATKTKMVEQLQRLADLLHDSDLRKQNSLDARIEAVRHEIESIIRRESKNLWLLSDPINLALWMSFFREHELEVNELLKPRPSVAKLYDTWRAYCIPQDLVSSEKMRQLISLSARRA
jgi:hypothetical protein